MDLLQQAWQSLISQANLSPTATRNMMTSPSNSGTSTPSSNGLSRSASPDIDQQQQDSLPRANTEFNTASIATSTTRSSGRHMCHEPQVNQYGNPVSPLERVYPKPLEDLDITEALSRKPLKHTFSHHVQRAAMRAEMTTQTAKVAAEEERERRKRELLGFQNELNSKMLGK